MLHITCTAGAGHKNIHTCMLLKSTNMTPSEEFIQASITHLGTCIYVKYKQQSKLRLREIRT